ncbi:MAG: hypothetical protein COT24_02265 [Candidatus Kerfeldbacteria bacterium CG08_land_8_20_14_0_20_40_16]|uniref:Uncharacterized protein n=1 Tax=Candidatus Kerfeldbacteria bacterium CG08_land_8_20_14_0_20_40_16 TaxID=2014244 RepID=A0A2H0YW08_9BACT|nr:MAG: hypothetical protein COT24_02265 [Candidatus Kerfeldbacteria bacterium CG08_land_8_20_14_0_20_40_16]
MNQEKWENLIGSIKDQFEIVEHKTEAILDGKGSVEYICFKGPLGKIKLEREMKPVVTGRKVISSRRIGSEVSEELEYSDSDMIDKLNAYRWNEEQDVWEEISADQIAEMSN